jgi:hypothetical protein
MQTTWPLPAALAAEEDTSGPVAGGSHSPRGAVTEISGISHAARVSAPGSGAAAVTAALCRDAADRGIGLCCLSAGSHDIARIYQRVGFVRIGTACIAEPAIQQD